MHNRSFIKSNENGLVYMWGHFANVSIKKPFVCEYTNVFDVFNSMTAQSSMSVVHEFTKEECDILNDLEAAFNDRVSLYSVCLFVPQFQYFQLS